ncbi:uncharacterized protein (DUF1499 family) [Rhodobium orientis]|uniref:DUF1499 domain-containing protein n=1 Tax=Rhodobium orientis TaxID=34017 RepID=A0A327JPV4_9HYPH|nr:DUF1499 domain-containing protein [Rhodobium orientis]MBB4303701.1 uncharacterized protein (DUF1499 family) [Rhodobium orientis]MBK5951844.1 hypothetical protein [Rhodobium orientis]RAI28490.1 hypothetical protein CH339_06280 [Rhodobium orientis]
MTSLEGQRIHRTGSPLSQKTRAPLLDRLWQRLAGPADQGPVKFASLQRRPTPNDALACSPGACAVKVDIELPFYAPGPDALLRRLDSIALDLRPVDRVDGDARAGYRRYVFRTTLMRFPDTLDAEAEAIDEGKTALRLYSRSLMGRSDLGANRKRLEKIAARLKTDAAD